MKERKERERVKERKEIEGRGEEGERKRGSERCTSVLPRYNTAYQLNNMCYFNVFQ